MIYFGYIEIIVNRCKLYVIYHVTKNIGRIGGRLRVYRVRVDAGLHGTKSYFYGFFKSYQFKTFIAINCDVQHDLLRYHITCFKTFSSQLREETLLFNRSRS